MDADLCVIGGGGAGFATAMAGAALGLKVTLIDPARAEPCWRNWDVALLALRHATRRPQSADQAPTGPDLASFRADLRQALGRAAPDRRFARLAAMNVRLLRGRARFADPASVVVAGRTLRARRFVLATGAAVDDGSDALLAALLGSDPFPESVSFATADHRSVALAQGLRRLGCRVILPDDLLPGWDAELTAPLRRALVQDGVAFDGPAGPEPIGQIAGDPDSAGLAHAGVELRSGRVVLSPALRTTNRRVYAAGAVAGARSSAETQAQVAAVLKSAFFRLPVRYDPTRVPVCLVGDPAIATVGLSEAAAKGSGRATAWRWPFAETAAGSAVAGAPGFLKVVVDGGGRVVGAGIVHPDAAEFIAFWAQAVHARQPLTRLAEVALPSPAFADAFRRVATLGALRRLQSPWVRRTLTLLNRKSRNIALEPVEPNMPNGLPPPVYWILRLLMV